MIEAPISDHLNLVRAASAPFVRFLLTSRWSRRMGAPGICDFVVGNPHDMPLPAYVDAIQRASVPRDPGWFGYRTNEPSARRVVSRSLRERLGAPFEDEDIFLTKG